MAAGRDAEIYGLVEQPEQVCYMLPAILLSIRPDDSSDDGSLVIRLQVLYNTRL